MFGVLKWLPLLWGKTVSLSLWRLHQPGAWSFLPSQLHTVPPHPILTSAKFHRPALFYFFLNNFCPLSDLQSPGFHTLSPSSPLLCRAFPHFLCSVLLFTAYFPLSKYIQPPKQISIVPASFHSALCQCSSQITKAISEISLTRGSRSFKM